MEHRQIIVGDYVFTPCKNAFNSKTSYWISKKDHWLAVYAFTPMDAADLREHTEEDALNGYIWHYEAVLAKNGEAKRLRTLLQNAVEVIAEDCCFEQPRNKKNHILNGLGAGEEELKVLGIDLEEAIK